jgi:hypothetical protein
MAGFCERCHVVSPCVVVVHWSQVGAWTLLGTDRRLTTAPGRCQRDVSEVQEVWGGFGMPVALLFDLVRQRCRALFRHIPATR